MFNIVLVHPEIPHNAGAAGRLALATGSTLHLVKPLGFSLDEKSVRRAGLDYWKEVNLILHDSLDHFLASLPQNPSLWLGTTKSTTRHWDAKFKTGDYLLFGAETKGLPKDLIALHNKRAIRIPMQKNGTRSLNLSTSVAIVLYEALRQVPTDNFQ